MRIVYPDVSTLACVRGVSKLVYSVSVDVFIDATPELAGYEIALDLAGGDAGSLDFVSITVDTNRQDFAFYGLSVVKAIDNVTPRVAIVNDTGDSIAITGQVYLATFTYQASQDAAGVFSIVTGDSERAFLLDSQNARVIPLPAEAALVGVDVLCTDDDYCDDGNPCTDDTCDPATGCANVNNDANSCDDGNPCTSTACVSGVCQVTNLSSGTSCEDGLGCNGVDTCDGNGICTHAGDPCRRNETCNECFSGDYCCIKPPATFCVCP